MTRALDRKGRFGAAAFTSLEHDPARALRPQRDRVDAAFAGLLGLPHDAVTLRRRPGRKPLLEAAAPSGGSIAHCGAFSLVAAVRGRDLGVDLEAVRPELALDELAAAFFTAAEVRWLGALPPGSRPLATTLLWSAKEALLKATGAGITAGLRTPGLDGLDLSPLLDGANRLVAALPDDAEIHLRHGVLGPSHTVMAAVTLPLARDP